jgi:hypothetical protein
MAVDFDCSDKASSRIRVNRTTTVAFQCPVLVHVSVRCCVLFIGRQLQNFCDNDITNSSTDMLYTGRPIENQVQIHGKLKDLSHVRVCYGSVEITNKMQPCNRICYFKIY